MIECAPVIVSRLPGAHNTTSRRQRQIAWRAPNGMARMVILRGRLGGAGGAQRQLADDFTASAARIVAVPHALRALRIVRARFPLEAVRLRPERVLPLARLDDAPNWRGPRWNDLSTQLTSEHSHRPSTAGSRFGQSLECWVAQRR